MDEESHKVAEHLCALLVTSRFEMLSDLCHKLRHKDNSVLCRQVHHSLEKYKNEPFCYLIPRLNEYIDFLMCTLTLGNDEACSE
jgi:hypothetical protein